MKVDPKVTLEVWNVLKGCTVDGLQIKHPTTFTVEAYDILKLKFKSFGGKPDPKKNTFTFVKNTDVQAVLDEVTAEAAQPDEMPVDTEITEDEVAEGSAKVVDMPSGKGKGKGAKKLSEIPAPDGEITKEQHDEIEAEFKEPAPVPVKPSSAKEKKTLKYIFNEAEARENAQQLARLTKSLVSLEAEKTTVVAQYGAKIKEVKASTNKISAFVSDGFELRDVDVEIFYHVPETGMKKIVRADTGEETFEKMEHHEFNLFNQPPDAGGPFGGSSYVELDV